MTSRFLNFVLSLLFLGLFSSQALSATTDLSGKAAWSSLYKGAQYDPLQDTQAQKAGTEIVGDDLHASFYYNYDDLGTVGDISDDILSLRLRIGDETKVTHSAYAFVGIALPGDGMIDAFVTSGAGITGIWLPGSDLNLSPSTTSIAGTPAYSYAASPTRYNFALVSESNDPDWNGNTDLNSDGNLDVFVSFAIPMADLATLMASQGLPMDASTGLRFISFTATQTNTLNSDFNGVGSDAASWNLTYEELGMLTDAVTSTGVVDTTPPAEPTVVSQSTEDTTPTITGTYDSADAAGGFTVTVNAVTYTLGDGNLSAVGDAWSLTIPAGSELSLSTYDVTATVTDGEGNAASDATTGELSIVDTTPPAEPTVVSQSTEDTTPTITGTYDSADAAGGFTVTVNAVTYTLGDGNLSAVGDNWSLTIPSALGLSTYDVTATATDGEGNAASDATTGELSIVDTTAPTVPTVVSQSTEDTTPTITGTYDSADAAGGFTVTVNAVTYTLGDGNLSAVGDAWSLTIPSALALNTYDVTATATDGEGNAASDATTGELSVVDTTAPSLPTVVSQSTEDTTPTITGTYDSADAAGGFTVTVNAVTYSLGDGNLSAVGDNWSLIIPAGSELSLSTYDVTATATDGEGNAASDATSGELSIVDTTPPAEPTVVSQSTEDTTPTITGTYDSADAAGGFTVTVNAVTYSLGDGNLSAVGDNWSLIIPAGSELSLSTYDVTATATDGEGNAASDATTGELSIVDTTAPTVPTVVSQSTEDTTPTITGTYDSTDAAGGFTVTVNAVTYSLGDGSLSAVGDNWSLIILAGSELSLSTYDVTATATDGEGNAASDATSGELSIVDTTAPTVPTVVSQSTEDTTPTITGTYDSADAAGGFSVTVNAVTYTLGDGNLSAVGDAWSLTIPSALALNIYDVTATAIDGEGNSASDATSGELSIVDTTAPTVPTVVSQSTEDTTPTITGTYDSADAAGGFTVTVNAVTYTLGDGNLSATGDNWSLIIPAGSELSLSTYDVTATATDGEGNAASDATSGELSIVDTTAPTVPTVVSQSTEDTTPTITGTYDSADAAGGFTVTVNAVTYTLGDGNLTAVGDAWSLTIPSALALNIYDVTATAIDGEGNSASDATSGELSIVDTTAPTVPTVVSQSTEDTTPTITGTYDSADAAGGFTVTVNAVTYTLGDGNLSAVGDAWSLTIPSALGLNTYDVTATATDGEGNAASDATTGELSIVDTTAPTVPTVVSQSTEDTTPTITGTYDSADAAGGFTVTVNAVTYTLGDGNLSATGDNWSLIIPSALALNIYDVTATAIDGEGNSASDATSGELSIVDTTAPTVPTVTSQSTEDTTPTITGTYDSTDAAGGFTVTVNAVTYSLGDGSLSAVGDNWSLIIPAGSELSLSTYDVTATATDGEGNAASDATTGELSIVDTTAPTVPTVVSQSTEDTTPTITGTYDSADAAGGFTVSVNAVTYTLGDGNLSAVGDAWSLTIPSALALNVYDVTATATDGEGNAASDATSGELSIVDTTAPTVPTVVSQSTEDTTPTITGTYDSADAAGGFTVTVNAVTYTLGDGNLSAVGDSWSLTIPNALGLNTYDVTATAIDGEGNSASDATSGELSIVDTTAPTVPTVVSQSTEDTTPTITGTYDSADAAGGFTVTVNAVTYSLGDGNLSATGDNWSLQLPDSDALNPEAAYQVLATAIDEAGNEANDSSSDELVILDGTDTDGDGIRDVIDLDDDNDGIPDLVEGDGQSDSDGDGVVDSLDLDSDNDGIPDLYESGASGLGVLDADGNGRIDDTVAVGENGLADTLETAPDSGVIDYVLVDTDGDLVPDVLDLDSDNDGLYDLVESGLAQPGNLDLDGDGRVDASWPVGANGLADVAESGADDAGLAYLLADTDGDLVPGFRDLDSDNDGIPDVTEAGGSDPDGDGILGEGVPVVDLGGVTSAGPLVPNDTDGDGNADHLDLDSDNDGIADIVEAGSIDADGDGTVDGFVDLDGDGWDDPTSESPSSLPDSDGDGVPDYLDLTDTDGDGIPDRDDLDDDNDGIPDLDEGDGLADSDGDGIADSLDLDSDNDGIADLFESGALGLDTLDSDHDGRIDPQVPVGENGLADVLETAPDSGLIVYTLVDTDGDLVPDVLDLDSDNDGLLDLTESGIYQPQNLDTDGDGRIDTTYPVGENGLADVVETGTDGGGIDYLLADTDGDQVPGFRDLDSDNDGIPDVTEAGGSDPDGDGIIGEGQPVVNQDGIAGAGTLQPVDTDNDGVIDGLDLDSDNDGVMDIVEAGGVDLDGDGTVDGFVDADGDGWDDPTAVSPPPMPDADGDGIPDFQDLNDVDNDGIADVNDLDDDNDGIPDTLEGDGQVDTDGDSVPDSRDLDSDNDGIFDLRESGVADPAALDGDDDGRIDANGADDSNGLADAIETSPDSGTVVYNGGVPVDSDGDGQPDFRDLDSDADGKNDVLENGGEDPDQDGRLGTAGDTTANLNGVLAGTTGQVVDADDDGAPDYIDVEAQEEAPEAVIKTGLRGSGGCVSGEAGGFDPLLPALLLISMLLVSRGRRDMAKRTQVND